MSTARASKSNILFLTQFSILLAIEAIFCFTPLGSLPALGPIVATLALVPVIITAILLGTAAGTAMGFMAGLFSFMVWTFTPPSPIAFVFTPFYSIGDVSGNFWSLVICFVPRILAGTVTGAVYAAMVKAAGGRKNALSRASYFAAGALGSLTNTIGVMAGIYVFFGHAYTGVLGIAYELLLGIIGTTILTSGIPEAVVGALAAYFITRPVKQFMTSQRPGADDGAMDE